MIMPCGKKSFGFPKYDEILSYDYRPWAYIKILYTSCALYKIHLDAKMKRATQTTPRTPIYTASPHVLVVYQFSYRVAYEDSFLLSKEFSTASASTTSWSKLEKIDGGFEMVGLLAP